MGLDIGLIVFCGERAVRLGKETYGLDLFCIESYAVREMFKSSRKVEAKFAEVARKGSAALARKLPKGIDPLQPFLS